jgi:apolipoprotein N-acyltransferase
MTTQVDEPRWRTRQGVAASRAQTDLRYLWLALGTVSWLFAVGGRWDLPIAAWLFSVFLLRFSRTSSAASAIFLICLASAGAALFWALQLAVPMNAVVTLSIAYGLIFATPMAADRLVSPRLGPIAALFVYPAAHTACEFLLGTVSPQGASYGLLAVTQTANLPLLQMISVTGPYGVGFLICTLATVANWFWGNPTAWRQARIIVGAYLAVITIVMIGGGARLAFFPPMPDYVRVAGISPSAAVIAQAQVALGRPITVAAGVGRADAVTDQSALAPVVTELFDNTRRAARAGAKVVVWSENAAALAADGETTLLAQASGVARQERIYLLIADNLPRVHDETHLFAPDGRLVWTYEKAHPIPGLEPYKPGPRRPPSALTPFGRLANVICYEADFPEMMRAAVDIMLVPGGDWPEMGRVHTLKMANLRAIENGYALFRQDFNGLSAAFDHEGHVLATQDTTTDDQHVFFADVPTRGVTTLYRLIGDVFAWLCVLSIMGLIALAVMRPRSRRP